MARHASLARSGSLASLCVMYGAGIAFVTTLVVSNGIGAAGAGEFFRLMALFAIGTSLSVFGADTGLVRTMSAQRALGRYSALPQLIRFALFPSVLLAVVVALAALVYSLIMPGSDEYATALRVSAPFLIIAAAMTVGFGALRGLNQVVTFTLLQNVVLPTLRLAGVALAVILAGSLMGLVWAWTIPVIITTAVTAYLLNRPLPEEMSQDAPPTTNEHQDAPEETLRSFWMFSSARGVAAIVETALEWIDVLVIAAFLGPAAGGVYGAVNRCVRVGTMVEHTGRIVTGPSISAALATQNLVRAREIFLATTRVLTALAWPFYLSLAFFGPVLLRFFGKGFESGAGILWVICPAAMLAMSAGGVQSVLLMSGKSRWQLLNKLSALVLAIILNLTLVPLWGLYGAVTAWAAALLIDTFLASYQVFKLVGIRATVKEMAPALILGGAVPTVCALIPLAVLGQGLVALVLYLVLLVPSYGYLLKRFRKPLGVERFLSARKKPATAEEVVAAQTPENAPTTVMAIVRSPSKFSAVRAAIAQGRREAFPQYTDSGADAQRLNDALAHGATMVQLVGVSPQHPQRSSSIASAVTAALSKTPPAQSSDAPSQQHTAAETHLSATPPAEGTAVHHEQLHEKGQTPHMGREQESAPQANASSQDHSNPQTGKTPHIEKSPTVPIFLGAAAGDEPGSPDSAVGTLRNALPQDSAQPEADKSPEPARPVQAVKKPRLPAIAQATANGAPDTPTGMIPAQPAAKTQATPTESTDAEAPAKSSEDTTDSHNTTPITNHERPRIIVQKENTMENSSTSEKQPSASLLEQVQRVWRHKLIVLIPIVVMAILAGTYGVISPASYAAKSTVVVYPLVNDLSGTGSANSLKVDINTESRAASSRQVAGRAITKAQANQEGPNYQAMDVDKLMAATKVTGTSQSAVLDIEVTLPNAQQAADYANAVAEAYLEVRSEGLKANVEDRRKKLNEKIDEAQNSNTIPASELTQLRERLSQLELISQEGGRVVSSAQVPKSQKGLSPMVLTVVGGAFGLLVGIAAAYIYDRSMRTLGYAGRLKEMGIDSHELKPNDTEGALLLLHRVGATDGDLKKAGYAGITLSSASGKLAYRMYQALYTALPSDQVRFIDYKSLKDSHSLQNPEKYVAGNSIPVVVDLGNSATLPQVVRFSNATRLCLIPVNKDTNRAKLRELFSYLQTLENTVSIAVFMEPQKEG